MRSLAVKLTLAFLVVGLIGATMVAILVQRYTRREFDRLVLDQNQQALVEALTSYYAATGSWSGVRAGLPTWASLAAADTRTPLGNPPGLIHHRECGW